VIEFALLFGLGFLTAVFLVFLVAPAVHRRIVWFTEKRLKATMPLSPQEVRAQKDMARALYAAENAKTEQSLARERDQGIVLQLRQDELTKEAGRLASESEELRSQIDDMNVEAGDLRSRLRREESYISQLKTSLRISEQAHSEKESDLDTLRKRLHKSATDADNLRIDLAARETEVENLRLRFNSLREERDTLRHDLKLMTTRAKDAEQHLAEEEGKVVRLENKLEREVAGNADKDTTIERRLQDVARLKEKLKSANAEAREAGRALRAAGIAKPVTKSTNGAKPLPGPQLVRNAGLDVTSAVTAAKPEQTVETEIAKLTEEVRNRSNALSDRLLKSRSAAHDQAMREEIATIAANMVAITALKEGDRSPIFKLLPENGDHGQGGRVSLAERTNDLLPDR
jgi:chromosome segregation ATPase